SWRSRPSRAPVRARAPARVSCSLAGARARKSQTNTPSPGVPLMFNRRDFLSRTLGGSSLLALGGVVPEFLANTARAASAVEKPKDTVLVVIEMAGGNDGLNTVAPFADDLYHKNRPTLAITKKEALKLDDYCGLHPRMNEMKNLFERKQLAVIQGV